MKKFLSTVALAVLATTAYAQDKTIEQRVEDLELSRDLNWIKWGGSLETRYDYVDEEVKKDYKSGSDTITTGDNDAYFRMWANLNMEATPNERLSFFGRLSVAKYFSVLGEEGTQSSAFADLSDGATTRDSSVFLERGFANYKIASNLTFTMGRLPTIDGPNKHIALNQQLSGNYPTLAYSAILDGFALTHSHAMPESNQVLRTKLIFTPTSTVNQSGKVTNGSTQLRDASGKRVETTASFYSLLAEYEKTNGSFFKRNLTIFQWLHSDQNPFYQSSSTIEVPTSPTTTTDITVGSDLKVAVDRFVLYSEFEKIFHSEFDFAVQGMFSHTRSRGSLTKCEDSFGGAVCTGAGLGNAKGWNTNKNSDSMDGIATAVTLRYQTPFKFLNRPKIGAEWFQASKEAYVYDAANVNPINMYATQGGSTYHFFYNQQFDGGLSMNVGYMYQPQKMTREVFGIFGDEIKTDNINQNVYVSLLAVF
jgi:hypothetical protein